MPGQPCTYQMPPKNTQISMSFHLRAPPKKQKNALTWTRSDCRPVDLQGRQPTNQSTKTNKETNNTNT